MDQPVWLTLAGSLGTIPRGSFYETAVLAVASLPGNTVYYEVVAGRLPIGIQLSSNGILGCLLYTSPSPRDRQKSRMPSSA